MKSLTRLPNKPKSSSVARRLLEAIYKQEGSWERVAQRLGLKNRGHAWEMAKGIRHDTPEMKAAVRRAEHRAHRAFIGLKVSRQEVDVAPELIRLALTDLDRLRSKLRSLITEDGNGSNDATETTNG